MATSTAGGDTGDADGIKVDDGTMLSTYITTKQQKKEEGRRRALEIAKGKGKISINANNDGKVGDKNGKRPARKSARHGARNQHRHKHFTRWILERFPHILLDCINDQVKDQYSSNTRMHVLDVAGGKGELSARLSLCHSLDVVMIDPRTADVASVYMNSVVPKLPKKWQKSIQERLLRSPTFVQDELDKRFSQLVMPFYTPPQLFAMSTEVGSRFQDEVLDAALMNASLLIGLHADGATEAIVDAALAYCKPFVVVPCCVFPNLFRERYITVLIDDALDMNSVRNGERNGECSGSKHLNKTWGDANVLKEKRPVRTHDQFCQYLLAKDPRFMMEVLPFDGRNVAIWWDGKE